MRVHNETVCLYDACYVDGRWMELAQVRAKGGNLHDAVEPVTEIEF